MSKGINKVILVGNLGSDPEVKKVGESDVCEFRIATSESWVDKKSNEKQEKTEWHRIVVWGKLAEICGKYLEKGRQVYVEGKIQTRSWEDKDGTKRYMTEIVAKEVQFLGGKGKDGGSASDDHSPPPSDDEIPF